MAFKIKAATEKPAAVKKKKANPKIELSVKQAKAHLRVYAQSVPDEVQREGIVSAFFAAHNVDWNEKAANEFLKRATEFVQHKADVGFDPATITYAGE